MAAMYLASHIESETEAGLYDIQATDELKMVCSVPVVDLLSKVSAAKSESEYVWMMIFLIAVCLLKLRPSCVVPMRYET